VHEPEADVVTKAPMTSPDDHRARLERLRDQLAAAIESASENMLPQLAGQYRATLADLAALPIVAGKVPVKDELRARRQDRVAAAKAVPAARRGGQ
jgi:hypothetical protein